MGWVLKGLSEQYELRKVQDVIGGVAHTPTYDGPYILNRNRTDRNENDTVNFGNYVRKHLWKPENLYEIRHESTVFPHGYPHLKLVWIPNGDYTTYSGPDPNGFHNIPYLEPTSARKLDIYNSLAGRLLENVKDQKVNLAVFYAERHQMLDMFGNTINRVARAYSAVRRGRFREAFRALGTGSTKRVSPFKSPANNWLELQYGWLPLLSDMYGVSQEYEKIWARRIAEDKNPIQRTRVAFECFEADVVNSTSNSSIPLGMTLNREYIYLARVWCAYTVSDESLNLISRVGLTNPLAVAWEVVPFSFVVDWVLPVGRFLNTLDATVGLSFVSGGNSGLTHSNLRSIKEGTFVNGNFRSTWTCPGFGRYDRYERAPIYGFPAVTLPQLKDPVSGLHVANALALLAQAFSRK